MMVDGSRSNGRRGHNKLRAKQSTNAPVQNPTCEQPQGLQQVMTQLGELREYSAYYLRAQIDRVKVSLRRIALVAALIVLGAFALFAVVFTTFWLLLLGIAQGLGTVFGGRVWLGNISAALLTLLSLSAVVWLIVRRQKSRSYVNRVRQYRARQQQQKARFGHTVHDQATRHE
jgi:membrane protein implicated in regulation of membrane protease activity